MHTNHSKDKLILRTRRLAGQVKAVEKHLLNNEDCGHILQHLAACRGALNSLMSELIDEHVHYHVLDPKKKPTAEQLESAEKLMDIVNTYLK
jgi:DNA-binding FrmR family transcriptional regulator